MQKKIFTFIISIVIFLDIAHGGSNLLSRYMFSGNNIDSSNNFPIATAYDCLSTQDRNGTADKAFSFNGTSSYTNLYVDRLPIGNEPRTMNIWFKTNSTSDNHQTLIAYGTAVSGKPIFPLMIKNKKLYYESGSSSDTIYSAKLVNDNTWHMATISYNGDTLTLFLDGVKQAFAVTTLATATSEVWVGRCIWENGLSFTGSLDEPAIYNRCLSESEIIGLFSGTVPQKGLCAYYDFNNNLKNCVPYRINLYSTSFGNDRFGNPGKALNLYSSGAYARLDLPNIPDGKKPRTVSIWFKTDKKPASSSTYIFGYGGAVQGTKCVFPLSIRTDGKLEFEAGWYADAMQSKTSVCDNKWHMATLSYDTEKLRYFIDGVATDSVTTELQTVPTFVELGRAAWMGSYYYNGLIDDFCFYNTALSAKQIDSLFKDGGWQQYSNVPVTSVSILNNDTSFGAGNAVKLNAFVSPAYTTNEKITWESLDTNKATVDTNGFVLTNYKETGDVLIVCRSVSDNTKSDTIKINLKPLTIKLNEGLVAYYPLDGNADDEGQNHNNGTYYGVLPAPDRFGNSNGAMSFSYGNIIRAAIDPATFDNDWTISAWFTRDAVSSWGGIVTNSTEYYGSPTLTFINSGNEVGVSNAGTDPSNVTVDLGDNNLKYWIFATISYTKSSNLVNVVAYGPNGTQRKIDAPVWSFKKSGKIEIGRHFYYTYQNNHIGSIDDVRIYNRAINNKEIDSLFHVNGWKAYSNATVTKIKVNDVYNKMMAGSSTTFSAVTEPSNALNRDVKWKSDNSSLLKIDSITGKAITFYNKTGKVNVSCSLLSNPSVKASIQVTIVEQPVHIDSSLVFYYPFEENTKDLSGNNNHAINHNAIISNDHFGESRSAYSFNGNNQYLEVPSSATSDLHDFTFSCWIKTTESRSTDTYWERPFIFGNETSKAADADFGLVTNNGYLSIWSGLNVIGDETKISTKKINDNKWHFITCVKQLDSVKLYVDGEDINCGISTNQNTNNFGYWLMAQHNSQGGAKFFHQGSIDNVRLYSRGLNMSEIQTLYKELSCKSFIVAAGKDTSICKGNSVSLLATGNATKLTWTGGLDNATVITPVSSKQFIVMGYNTAGCAKSDTMNIFVNANGLPLVKAGKDTTICPNSKITLTGSGAVSYSWNNGVNNNVAFTPKESSEYIVTGTDANYCTNKDTVRITVASSPLIYAGADQEVCSGKSIILFAISNSTVKWSNNIANGTSFIPAQTATYIANATNEFGCTSSDTVKITVASCTGISKIEEGNKIEVYPSITRGIVNIKAMNLIISTIEIYSMNGSRVITLRNTENIDLTNYPNGIYYIRILTDSGIVNSKVIKQ